MFDNISFLTKLIFIITNIIFVFYIGYKFYRRKYIISIFNINIYIFAFALLFTSYFQFTNEAWGFLNVSNPSEYYNYLDKIIRINCIGFISFLIAMIIIEFKIFSGRIINSFINSFNNINKRFEKINNGYIKIIFIFCVIGWCGLILIAGEIPLFGDRLVFNRPNFRVLRPFYLILNYMISIIGSYFALKVVINKSKIDLVFLILTILILLLTGNRGPIMFLLLNVFMVFVYYTFKVMNANKLIVLAVSIILVLGISLSFVRNNEFSINSLSNSIKNEVIYGNTFSDVRDGAFVLKGFEEKYDEFLYGKNYLADIISFIPSSISEYREKWSYGSFSTKTLFNMEDHYGLRGGWFLEPYINFGYIGVIIIAILNGIIMGLAELIFCRDVIIDKNSKFPENQIFITFILFIVNSMLISSSFSNFYAYIAIIIAYYILHEVNKKFSIIR